MVDGVDLVDEEVVPAGWDGAGGVVDPAPLVEEGDLLVGVAGDLPALGVNEAVGEPAQGEEIIEVGGSAVGPVDDGMSVGPAGAVTSREAAATVATAERSPQMSSRAITSAASRRWYIAFALGLLRSKTSTT